MNKWPRARQLAQDIGTVMSVLKRRSDPPPEWKQMLARLEQWRTEVFAIIDEKQGEWTPTWPTTPGWYWFYGRRHDGDRPSLEPVEVFRDMTGRAAYVVRGSILYESEAEGVWRPVVIPDLPST